MLTTTQKKHLRKQCHALKPIVIVGHTGVSEAVIHELATSLEHHELLKIRVNATDKSERSMLLNQILQATNSDLVQSIGHTACIFRKKP